MRLNPFKPKRAVVGRTWPALTLSPGQFAVAVCAVFSLVVAAILALARVGNTKRVLRAARCGSRSLGNQTQLLLALSVTSGVTRFRQRIPKP
jgi:hypothetical protein